ncbi:hypothetical protein ERO13_A07G070800v2 [Gossypium hirsutum]|uniref:F-box domain-containing protein n=5 Tax=Gossypium TaxID=3633 RepID=A0A5J5V0V4_GOSBA|nr:F-box/kelch-repeat protein At1g74510-like isoform X2 [Gossypium hirsutum]KAB2073383.1 hypothetical protein ES319_A07G078900v1 [Gossypium barbadense]TYH09282.1 hypothetical protein ES288_A07G082700v1 [Gossypium darwinii]TYI18322.1 hypothetical protein ES332_A07G082100v1 [Gossypium tomentosum]TYJ25877.1 hypothetical protein E1A91_A07G079600v1 [Gossypium mustelinum]KAB2073384.1 hypothetical protein ES319_A07G078900v1 [Gossypium barbadense]
MLEGPSYLVSRDFPSSCEQESKWIYNTFHVTELARSKCQMEDGEDQMMRKVLKPLEGDENKGEKEDMSLAQFDCPDNHRHAGDHSETSLLIQQLGQDISINCLLRCSSLLEWEAFDPIRHRWMHLPKMTSNECFMCSDKESLAVGTELLVFGKEISFHVIYRYSILTNTWSSGMKMNTPRCLFGSASLGEIAILAGGCDPHGNILSSAELYNSETGKWVTIPNMIKARKMCSAVFMDRKFYVIGGIGVGSAKTLTCGEVYDLKTKMWHEIPNMYPARNGVAGATEAPAAAEAPPLVAVVNNELYAADYAEKEVRKYDKEKNLWVALGGLPDRAVSMNGWGLAFRACGDRLIVIGGPRALGEGMIELNSWVPNDGPPQWNLLARKPSGSFVYNCAVMGC